jgi:hypothetical protein
MGHSAESGSVLWPLRRISLSATGHSAESGSALWATAENFVKRYGPQRRVWLSAVGGTAQNFVKHYGSRRRIIDHSAES